MKQDGEKKPDLVVFNEETQQYDAALKPYGTSASSPVIKPLNTATWRNDGVQRVNKQFKSKFDEVRKEYEELMHFSTMIWYIILNLILSQILVRCTICIIIEKKNLFYLLLHQSNVIFII